MISLQVQGLTRKYNRKTILKGLTFAHSKGTLGIAGPNGSGKSTLMKCLAFLLRPNAGTIQWSENGSPLPSEKVRSLIGYAAPYINLYEELSVTENLEFLAKLGGSTPEPGFYRELLEKVQMHGFEHRLFKTLSTGQQQRVKLAASLVRSPGILFLDEPGSNLDEKGNSLVANIVQEQAQNNTLVIIASNDMREIGLCDQVIELDAS